MAASPTTATSSRPSRGVAAPNPGKRPETRPATLDTEVARSGLPGGPTVARAGRRLGVRTVRDLLFHLPRRYDDLREMRRIGDLTWVADGEMISARVRVADLRV